MWSSEGSLALWMNLGEKMITWIDPEIQLLEYSLKEIIKNLGRDLWTEMYITNIFYKWMIGSILNDLQENS